MEAGRQVLDFVRHSDETLTQFVMRREQNFTLGAAYDMTVSSKFQWYMMREGAALGPQGKQNLKTLMAGKPRDYESIVDGLISLDTDCMRAV